MEVNHVSGFNTGAVYRWSSSPRLSYRRKVQHPGHPTTSNNHSSGGRGGRALLFNRTISTDSTWFCQNQPTITTWTLIKSSIFPYHSNVIVGNVMKCCLIKLHYCSLPCASCAVVLDTVELLYSFWLLKAGDTALSVSFRFHPHLVLPSPTPGTHAEERGRSSRGECVGRSSRLMPLHFHVRRFYSLRDLSQRKTADVADSVRPCQSFATLYVLTARTQTS